MTKSYIFWADSKVVIDYHAFRDVVCFDTTLGQTTVVAHLFHLLELIIIEKQLYLVQLIHHKQMLFVNVLKLAESFPQSYTSRITFGKYERTKLKIS